MQDYKYLCAAVTICSTLVNIQMHTHTDRQTAFWPAYMKSSASQPENYISERDVTKNTYYGAADKWLDLGDM